MLIYLNVYLFKVFTQFHTFIYSYLFIYYVNNNSFTLRY
jgi:hypothetical protein